MNRKRVYNQFQINLIVFYSISFLLVPVFIIISYLFNIQNLTSPPYIVLIATFIALIFFTIGLVYLLIRRDFYERKLKPSYRREFIIIATLSAFGVMGFGIFFTYIGGSFFYVPHVIIPTFIVVYGIILYMGYRFFNINFLRD